MKVKGIFKILIIFVIAFSLSSNAVFADDEIDAITGADSSASSSSSSSSSEYSSFNQFESYAESDDVVNSMGENLINTVAGIILTILRIIALCMAVISLMFIGIRYMTTVDPHMKGEVKKQIPTYVLASVILFAAAGILQLVTIFVNDVLEIE